MEHLHSLHEKAKLEKSNGQLSHLFFPFFKIYQDGRVERFMHTDHVPPSDDPLTGVRSKDVIISPETGVSARLFIPKLPNPNCKFPLLIYIHGGGFSIQSAFSTSYNHYVKSLVAEANVIALSVDYRLAPEHPIPACYDDSWAAVQWAASHANGDGPETWLNNHADFSRVFFAGDSAGGNISNTLAVRVGSSGLPGVKVVGVVLVHPYFGGTGDDQMWQYMCPNHGGLEDPRLKPGAEDLARLGCERVLMFVAEKDHLRPVAWDYYEKLKKSEWKGTVEIVENHGEEHVFHLMNPKCENAAVLMKKIVSFLNQE